jgi:carboxyl-terminal processing protease
MKQRSIFAPAVVLTAAVLSGGWFLQRGVGQEQNVYYQVRLFEEVVDHVANQYVEDVDKGELYQSAIEGLLRELGDPNTSFISAPEYEDTQGFSA